jgi:excisionase family DNA binding protein
MGATVFIADSVEQLDHALTAAELARLLNVNPITIYRLAQQGRIPAFRIGSAVRFDPRALASWLRKQGGAL